MSIQSSTVVNSINNNNNTITLVQKELTDNKMQLDPASQGIVTRLSSQVSSYDSAQKNISAAQNVLSVSLTGLSSISNILSQMQSLATQSADSTVGAADKAKINQTFQSLMKQIDSLSSSSQINGVSLLSSGAAAMKVQSGINSADQTTINAVASDSTSLAINTLDVSTAAGATAAIDALKAATDTISTNQSSLNAYAVGLKSQSDTNTSISQNLQSSIDAIQKPDQAALQAQLQVLNNQQSINYYLMNQINTEGQAMLTMFR
jgi:flagellin-like hook-associated protein FlgL